MRDLNRIAKELFEGLPDYIPQSWDPVKQQWENQRWEDQDEVFKEFVVAVVKKVIELLIEKGGNGR